MANGHRNKNFIPSITQGNARIVDNEEIGRVLTSLFRSQFGSSRDSGFKISWSKLLASKTNVDLSSLDAPFTIEEVRKATFELGADKAPGPDVFPIFFFQNC